MKDLFGNLVTEEIRLAAARRAGPVYMHPTPCPAWVDAGTALALTYQAEIARLQSDNEQLREKLKKATR